MELALAPCHVIQISQLISHLILEEYSQLFTFIVC